MRAPRTGSLEIATYYMSNYTCEYCRALLERLLAGEIPGNFIEGMGCKGGCVGGPKRIIPREEGERNVDAYGGDAASPTPIDNPYVIELLGRLGYPTVESLLTENDIFSRKF